MANTKKFAVKNGLTTPVIDFISPSETSTILASMLDSGILSVSGTSGQLFSISDSMTGTIFAVNDISGIPSIEVFDTGKVQIAELGGNILIGSSADDGTNKVQITGKLKTTDSLTITKDWNVTDGNAGLYLNGVTGNRIDYNVNGVAAPTFTTRSAGTKIVLYPAISGTTSDFALGIEGSTLWTSVANSGHLFKWYHGISNTMTLTSAGLGIGITYPSAKVHSISTTEQLRLGYDASNYTAFTVNSGGNLTITPSGTSSNINSSLGAGSGCITTGSYSTAFGYNTSSTNPGQFSVGYSPAESGVAQAGIQTFYTQTTDATVTILSVGNNTSNRMIIPAKSVCTFHGTISAMSNTYYVKGWEIKGIITRDASGVTRLIGTASISSLGADANAASWDIYSVTADDTNDALAISVIGQAAITIRWQASIFYSQVGYV